MSVTEFDADRPPELPRNRGGKRRRRRGLSEVGMGDGSREGAVVEDVEIERSDEFDSYYGRPVVKAPPWEEPIAIYLFLGGVAAGSSLLAFGAQCTGRELLRRNARLTAFGTVSLGTVALVADLGRPERFLNMMRVIKVASPMSLGTWIVGGFASLSGVLAALEIDEMTGRKLPLGVLRKLLLLTEGPSALGQVVLAPLLASYTGALFGNTIVPTWQAGRGHLSYLFVSSASLAASGAAMLTTPVAETKPARLLAAAGVVGEVVSMHRMKESMHPLESEPLEIGRAGTLLKWSERLAIVGGVGALLGGRNRVIAAASGAALLTSSALTRFGVLYAGLESVKDPRRVIEPQKARLAARRAAGIIDDSITTVG